MSTTTAANAPSCAPTANAITRRQRHNHYIAAKDAAVIPADDGALRGGGSGGPEHVDDGEEFVSLNPLDMPRSGPMVAALLMLSCLGFAGAANSNGNNDNTNGGSNSANAAIAYSAMAGDAHNGAGEDTCGADEPFYTAEDSTGGGYSYSSSSSASAQGSFKYYFDMIAQSLPATVGGENGDDGSVAPTTAAPRFAAEDGESAPDASTGGAANLLDYPSSSTAPGKKTKKRRGRGAGGDDDDATDSEDEEEDDETKKERKALALTTATASSALTTSSAAALRRRHQHQQARQTMLETMHSSAYYCAVTFVYEAFAADGEGEASSATSSTSVVFSGEEDSDGAPNASSSSSASDRIVEMPLYQIAVPCNAGGALTQMFAPLVVARPMADSAAQPSTVSTAAAAVAPFSSVPSAAVAPLAAKNDGDNNNNSINDNGDNNTSNNTNANNNNTNNNAAIDDNTKKQRITLVASLNGQVRRLDSHMLISTLGLCEGDECKNTLGGNANHANAMPPAFSEISISREEVAALATILSQMKPEDVVALSSTFRDAWLSEQTSPTGAAAPTPSSGNGDAGSASEIPSVACLLPSSSSSASAALPPRSPSSSGGAGASQMLMLTSHIANFMQSMKVMHDATLMASMPLSSSSSSSSSAAGKKKATVAAADAAVASSSPSSAVSATATAAVASVSPSSSRHSTVTASGTTITFDGPFSITGSMADGASVKLQFIATECLPAPSTTAAGGPSARRGAAAVAPTVVCGDSPSNTNTINTINSDNTNKEHKIEKVRHTVPPMAPPIPQRVLDWQVPIGTEVPTASTRLFVGQTPKRHVETNLLSWVSFVAPSLKVRRVQPMTKAQSGACTGGSNIYFEDAVHAKAALSLHKRALFDVVTVNDADGTLCIGAAAAGGGGRKAAAAAAIASTTTTSSWLGFWALSSVDDYGATIPLGDDTFLPSTTTTSTTSTTTATVAQQQTFFKELALWRQQDAHRSRHREWICLNELNVEAPMNDERTRSGVVKGGGGGGGNMVNSKNCVAAAAAAAEEGTSPSVAAAGSSSSSSASAGCATPPLRMVEGVTGGGASPFYDMMGTVPPPLVMGGGRGAGGYYSHYHHNSHHTMMMKQHNGSFGGNYSFGGGVGASTAVPLPMVTMPNVRIGGMMGAPIINTAGGVAAAVGRYRMPSGIINAASHFGDCSSSSQQQNINTIAVPNPYAYDGESDESSSFFRYNPYGLRGAALVADAKRDYTMMMPNNNKTHAHDQQHSKAESVISSSEGMPTIVLPRQSSSSSCELLVTAEVADGASAEIATTPIPANSHSASTILMVAVPTTPTADEGLMGADGGMLASKNVFSSTDEDEEDGSGRSFAEGDMSFGAASHHHLMALVKKQSDQQGADDLTITDALPLRIVHAEADGEEDDADVEDDSSVSGRCDTESIICCGDGDVDFMLSRQVSAVAVAVNAPLASLLSGVAEVPMPLTMMAASRPWAAANAPLLPPHVDLRQASTIAMFGDE